MQMFLIKKSFLIIWKNNYGNDIWENAESWKGLSLKSGDCFQPENVKVYRSWDYMPIFATFSAILRPSCD